MKQQKRNITLVLAAGVLSFTLVTQTINAAETYSPFYNNTTTKTETTQSRKSVG